jgi:NRPS condensation-like uncharacterized protein
VKKDYDFYWKKLDNAGTFYASTTSTYSPNIYRLSVKLKEKIRREVLVRALNETLLAIPSFRVKLRRGFFWYYLDRNNDDPIIMEDQYFPFTSINNLDNNYFLFKVTYFSKRINIDFSHILTDGTGALNFLETLVINYIKIRHPKKVKQDIMAKSELLSQNEMSIDSFLKYSNEKEENRKILKEHSYKSYFIKGSKISREGSNVIIGTISVEQLKTITKKYNVTITSYLTALLINSIYQENYKYNRSKNPIVICIPINLRNYFPSYSMNNFFASILISIDFSKKEYSFDEILNIVSTRLKEELDESVLIKKFKFYVRLQHNIILRVIPLIIKDVLLKEIGGLLSGHGATTTISNLGIVDVSNEVVEYIDKVDTLENHLRFSPSRSHIHQCDY